MTSMHARTSYFMRNIAGAMFLIFSVVFCRDAWGHEDRTIELNSGAGLAVFIKTDHATSSLRGPGDIVSMRFKGREYQDPLKGSHVNSGFRGLYPDQDGVWIDSGHVGHVSWVKVQAGYLTHYYMMREGENVLYMGTYFTQEPRPGLVRFIARIPYHSLPHGIEEGDVNNTRCCVEAHDVFLTEDGQTRSKHYTNERLIDWKYFGATGDHVGIWLVRDNAEGGSGGPFYRSLRDQGTRDQELTYPINYGEAQTEAYRMNILNRYALVFTDGPPPPPLAMDWQESLKLPGLTTKAERGRLQGHAPIDIRGRQHYVVGLSGDQGQYWGRPDRQTGNFNISDIRPGLYRVTLYKDELSIFETMADIQAGRVKTLSFPMRSHLYDRPVFWRIGQWDGTPKEFRNGDKLTKMHPSDPRMAPWQIKPYLQEASMAWDFPACQWQDVNNDLRIEFPMKNLPTREVTLRIGISVAFAHARPDIIVNGWHGPILAPSQQPKSRTLTVGTYRGNNALFTYKIPREVLHKGNNELTIHVASGSHSHGFLSPGYAFDAIDLGY